MSRPTDGFRVLARLLVVIALANGSMSGTAAAAVTVSQQAELTVPGLVAGDLFGSSIAVDGDTVIVGAPGTVVSGITSHGVAYVFVRNGSAWTLQATLTALETVADDFFGVAVAIKGDTAVVSSTFANGDKGAAYVFTRIGQTWSEQAVLTAVDAEVGASFGATLAVSDTTILVGAFQQGNKGAVFVFSRLFNAWPRTGLMTATVANRSFFGSALAISDDTALIGAPFDVAPGGNQGSAFVFTKSGATWTEQAKLQPAGSAYQTFGNAVGLEGGTAIINSATPRAAFVFTGGGAAWTQEATLDVAGTDTFAASVDVGENVAVASSYDGPAGGSAGSVHLFLRNGTTWSKQSTIAPVDAAADDFFGLHTVISGRTIVANSPSHAGIGAVWVFFETPVNEPPQLSAIADQTTNVNTPVSIPFTMTDVDTPLSGISFTTTISDQTLVPGEAVSIVNNGGGSFSLVLAPASGKTGVTTITLGASDGQSIVTRTFSLSVVQPAPPPPAPLPTYYLAEGSTGAFFDTDLLLANPNDTAAPVSISLFKEDGTTVTLTRTLAPLSRVTIHVDEVAGMESTSFSTAITSTSGQPLIVERTMWWDRTHYGAHGEKAVDGAVLQWYFAEGSQGFFSTYFLLVNPQATPNAAHVTYFREGEGVLTRDYNLPPSSRVTIDAGADKELVNRSFGARIVFDQPGAAERAMYFGRSPLFTGGHDAAGATAPSTTWFLAEGATGSFFNTFVLLANPNTIDATATVTYFPSSGMPVTRQHVVPGGQRVTINIATEDDTLASAAVSTRVESNQPLLVERSQYWPVPDWYESHNSFGVTALGTHWGLAEGRVGDTPSYQTYILLANPGTTPANVTVRFLRTSGAPLVKTFTVAPTSRFNVAVTGPGSDAPELIDEEFGAVIESTQPIAVERALYANANGIVWAAGTNATATRLP